jgi:hypothetical protein
MGRLMMWIESNVIGLPPLVGLAGQLVGDDELVRPVHAKRRQIQIDGRLTYLVRVEIHDGQHRVGLIPGGKACSREVGFGEADDLGLVDVMEP